MPDYSKAKIYKIFCNITGQTYYGSTVQPLYKRVNEHRSGFKRWKNGKYAYAKSYDIIERGDYDYSLVEEFPCDRKEQLHSRERYWIENNECVNKVIPGRTQKEYREVNKERRKEYYEQNKEQIRDKQKEYYEANKGKMLERCKEYREANKERRKEYREDNKEQIREYMKEYREANKEHIAERKKEYSEQNKEHIAERKKEYYEQNKEHILDKQKERYEANREKIVEQKKEKIVCECGSEVTKTHLARHLKTKKHLTWVESQCD
ncbi:hypothetical protein OAY23_01890 [bacterium]|nr:hypothetical protein [bacterium]